jgi:hypothetical protein
MDLGDQNAILIPYKHVIRFFDFHFFILKPVVNFIPQKIFSLDALRRAQGRVLSFESKKSAVNTFAIKKIAVAIALTSGCVLSAAYLGLAHASPASNALPAGGQVAAGSANIATSGSTMTVTQSSQRAVVNWGWRKLRRWD